MKPLRHSSVQAGYKQTEVGVIPEEWEVVALGLLTTTVASGKSSSGAGQGTYPVHGSTGVIGYTEHPEYEGDSILAARVGANAGKLNLVSGKYGVTDNTIMLRLRGGYSLPFFWRQLETKRLNSLVFGSGQPLITGSQLKALSLSVPPLPEQRAIATALSDVDGLLGGLDRLIAKKRDLKQAAMQQLLTGQTRLPGWDGAWEETTLGELATFLSGGTPSRSNDDYWTGDIPWISASSLRCFEIWRSDSNVTKEAVDAGSKMAPVGSSLLLVRGSALHNEILCGLVTKPVCFNQDVKALVPRSQVVPRFLTLFIRGTSEEFLKLVSSAGNTAGVLDTKLVKAFAINLPSLPEQTAIASVLTEMDGELAVLEQRREKTRALKLAMMQELLTGRTRLL